MSYNTHHSRTSTTSTTASAELSSPPQQKQKQQQQQQQQQQQKSLRKQKQHQQQQQQQQHQQTTDQQQDDNENENTMHEGEDQVETPTEATMTRLGPKSLAVVGVVESAACLIESSIVMLFIQSTWQAIVNVVRTGLGVSLPGQVDLAVLPATLITHTLYMLKRYKYLFQNVSPPLRPWFGMSGSDRQQRRIVNNEALMFMACMLGLFIASLVQQYATGQFIFNMDNIYTVSTFNKSINYFSLVSILIFAPISEELIFRGFILYILRRRSDNVKFCVITSNIIFGLFHLVNLGGGISFYYILLQITMGVLFGINLSLFFLQTGTLATPILIHIFNNSLSIFLPTTTTNFANIIILPYLTLEVLMTIGFYRRGISRLGRH
ncbi:hypothetical protein SAMD00019534_076640 [Acytostelium subglobosum LB1]|uniref:hypothetical protein n=1 Tax=Acytostelium subglobosum LB1 TaxID=1410327 RepID=UPI000644F265|nr:hypothetical protein SAMD00019534_076640 [Acytostelium subglobosum LB1]GAM24489.1 hypothetical protein SAMD00019534_076640 [Acytostelium subglobosum LB1]|eukprot:XP_012752815.1 hypothetical protein SAMD00019534_076640 [Acytostelium subglobosum LB1]